jgi:hypothetical protein
MNQDSNDTHDTKKTIPVQGEGSSDTQSSKKPVTIQVEIPVSDSRPISNAFDQMREETIRQAELLLRKEQYIQQELSRFRNSPMYQPAIEMAKINAVEQEVSKFKNSSMYQPAPTDQRERAQEEIERQYYRMLRVTQPPTDQRERAQEEMARLRFRMQQGFHSLFQPPLSWLNIAPREIEQFLCYPGLFIETERVSVKRGRPTKWDHEAIAEEYDEVLPKWQQVERISKGLVKASVRNVYAVLRNEFPERPFDQLKTRGHLGDNSLGRIRPMDMACLELALKLGIIDTVENPAGFVYDLVKKGRDKASKRQTTS